MALRKPKMPGAADHLVAKLDAAVAESMASSRIGEPVWSRMFCFCGDGMYRISVRCNRAWLDVSVRSVTSDGEEDDEISIMFCASLGHRSKVQVEHSARELDADVFSTIRFGTDIAEAAAASWERVRREQESLSSRTP